VGPRAGLDVVVKRKILPCQKPNPSHPAHTSPSLNCLILVEKASPNKINYKNTQKKQVKLSFGHFYLYTSEQQMGIQMILNSTAANVP
jgi:hypothetical protein